MRGHNLHIHFQLMIKLWNGCLFFRISSSFLHASKARPASRGDQRIAVFAMTSPQNLTMSRHYSRRFCNFMQPLRSSIIHHDKSFANHSETVLNHLHLPLWEHYYSYSPMVKAWSMIYHNSLFTLIMMHNKCHRLSGHGCYNSHRCYNLPQKMFCI